MAPANAPLGLNIQDAMNLPVSYADVVAAAARIEGAAHRTPVLTSSTADLSPEGTAKDLRKSAFGKPSFELQIHCGAAETMLQRESKPREAKRGMWVFMAGERVGG